jgi:Domain of unknown function (DUF4234)
VAGVDVREAAGVQLRRRREGDAIAQELGLASTTVKRRNPWGTFGLAIITLGIYHVVWWYKINRELRDVSAGRGRPLDNNPVLAVLALVPGGLVIVPAILTYVYTARRARAVREMVAPGAEPSPNSPLTVVLALVGGFHSIYVQYALNWVWDRSRAQEGPAAA